LDSGDNRARARTAGANVAADAVQRVESPNVLRGDLHSAREQKSAQIADAISLARIAK
jgi:hypothetical protein